MIDGVGKMRACKLCGGDFVFTAGTQGYFCSATCYHRHTQTKDFRSKQLFSAKTTTFLKPSEIKKVNKLFEKIGLPQVTSLKNEIDKYIKSKKYRV